MKRTSTVAAMLPLTLVGLLVGCNGGPRKVAPFATDLSLSEPDGLVRPSLPATFAVPLAPGELTDDQMETIRLVVAGEPTSAGFYAAQRWSDNSVRWLHCDTVLPALSPHQRVAMRIDNDQLPQYPPPIDPAIRVRFEPTATKLEVMNGPLRMQLLGNGATLFNELRFDPKSAGPNDPQLLGPGSEIGALLNGQLYVADLDTKVRPQVLHHSAGKAVLQLAGSLTGPGAVKGLDYEILITVYSGRPEIKLQVTLTNRQGLVPADQFTLGDAWIKLATRFDRNATVHLSRHGPPLRTIAASAPRIVAAASDRYFLASLDGQGKWKIRDGGVPNRDRPQGLGWVDISSADGSIGLAAGIPDFWQSHPRLLGVSNEGALLIGLFAGQAADAEVPMHMGVARTTEVTLLPHGPIPDAMELAGYFNAVDHPVMPLAPQARYGTGTKIYGPIAESTADYGKHAALAREYDLILATSLEKIIARQQGVTYKEAFSDAYGWLNWGDTYHWAFGPASDPMNLQWDAAHYDYPWAMILQGLRTGDQAFLRRGLLGASYGMDVHTVHLGKDDPRTGAPRVSPARGHVGSESSQAMIDKRMDWLTGLSTVARWQLLGDWRARQVSDEMFARAWRTIIEDEGWDSPRGAGNHISILLTAWELTGDDRYMKRAATIVSRGERIIESKGDLPDQPQNRYRYGIGLEGLLKYAWSQPQPPAELVTAIRTVVDKAIERDLKGYNSNMAAACGFCWKQTDEQKYLDAMVRLLNSVGVTSRTKTFGVELRTTPYAMYYLHEAADD